MRPLRSTNQRFLHACGREEQTVHNGTSPFFHLHHSGISHDQSWEFDHSSSSQQLTWQLETPFFLFLAFDMVSKRNLYPSFPEVHRRGSSLYLAELVWQRKRYIWSLLTEKLLLDLFILFFKLVFLGAFPVKNRDDFSFQELLHKSTAWLCVCFWGKVPPDLSGVKTLSVRAQPAPSQVSWRSVCFYQEMVRHTTLSTNNPTCFKGNCN